MIETLNGMFETVNYKQSTTLKLYDNVQYEDVQYRASYGKTFVPTVSDFKEFDYWYLNDENTPYDFNTVITKSFNLHAKEKDATYDDLSLLVPKEIEELLISYKSRNNSGIKMKRIILEKLYQFLLSDIDKYKSYNSSLFSSIKTVITKMGVSQEIDKKYQNLTNYKLRKYYDNCYQMILYLIKTEEVLKAKEELKNF